MSDQQNRFGKNPKWFPTVFWPRVDAPHGNVPFNVNISGTTAQAAGAAGHVLNVIDGMYRRGPQHVANIQVTCGYHTSNSQLAVNQRSPKKQFLSHRQW
ncbi:unnamed protein product [Caenorhabditis nigoni]